MIDLNKIHDWKHTALGTDFIWSAPVMVKVKIMVNWQS